tara:strand:- start:3817 stop:4359 length:543 start_codon:yes stop_codon:yes gene_type:complete
MAHFAKLGINGQVIKVQVIDNNVCKDADGNENEQIAIDWLEASTGWPLWKQCSYNTVEGKHYNDELKSELSADQSKVLRANFPGIGWVYDETNDIFKQPDSAKPYASWTMNTTTGLWTAPVTKPTEDQQSYEGSSPNRKQYALTWDESGQRWLGSPVGTDATVDAATKVWVPGSSSWTDK